MHVFIGRGYHDTVWQILQQWRPFEAILLVNLH